MMELIIDIPDSVVQGREPTIIQEGIVTPTVTLVTRWITKEESGVSLKQRSSGEKCCKNYKRIL